MRSGHLKGNISYLWFAVASIILVGVPLLLVYAPFNLVGASNRLSDRELANQNIEIYLENTPQKSDLHIRIASDQIVTITKEHFTYLRSPIHIFRLKNITADQTQSFPIDDQTARSIRRDLARLMPGPPRQDGIAANPIDNPRVFDSSPAISVIFQEKGDGSFDPLQEKWAAFTMEKTSHFPVSMLCEAVIFRALRKMPLPQWADEFRPFRPE